jgi:6-phosphogluconolactonase
MTKPMLYVGSYTTAQGGSGVGVSVREISQSGQLLTEQQVVALSNPAFLTLGADLLFAAEEQPSGRIVSMARERGRLTVVASADSGGGLPCHLAVDVENDQLIVANYLTGTVASLAFAPGGELANPRSTAMPAGTGPVAERQESPHAHQVVHVPGSSGEWLVSDLGGDRVLRFSAQGRDAAPVLLDACQLPAGSGPRHMGWVHESLLVAGELDSQLHILSPAREGLSYVGAVSTHDGESREESGPNFPSHVEISSNQEFAFVANRGRDSITVFDVSEVRNGGMPVLIREVPSGGKWPRHFVFHESHLYVANQRSNSIAVFAADRDRGLVFELTQLVRTGSPMCLVISDEG